MARNGTDLITTNFSGIKIGEGAQQTNQTRQKKDTQFWVNVGVERTAPDGTKVLVSLPMGIPLDELQARKIPSEKTQNQQFRNLRLAEHDLWSKIQEVMSTLKPGQEVDLPFSVKLRRVDEKEVPEEQDPSVNPFAIGSLKLA